MSPCRSCDVIALSRIRTFYYFCFCFRFYLCHSYRRYLLSDMSSSSAANQHSQVVYIFPLCHCVSLTFSSRISRTGNSIAILCLNFSSGAEFRPFSAGFVHFLNRSFSLKYFWVKLSNNCKIVFWGNQLETSTFFKRPPVFIFYCHLRQIHLLCCV